MRRAPLLSALAVLCMGLGVGAVTTVYSTASAFTFKPLPQLDDPGRLVHVAESPARTPDASDMISPAGGLALSTIPAFSHVGLMRFYSANVAGGDVPEQVTAMSVNADFFGMVGREPAVGRAFRPDEDVPGGPRVVVLGYGLWQRRFGGDPAVVGRPIPLNGVDHVVVGVMPREFGFASGTQAWVPLALAAGDAADRADRSVFAMARLADGVSPDRMRADLAVLGERLAREFPAGDAALVLRADAAEEYFGRGPRPFMIVMLAGVAFLLLIACANVASLLLARATSRRREIAVRIALGAGRGRIVRQLLTESTLLALAGAGLGLLVAQWGVAGMQSTIPTELQVVISGFSALHLDAAAFRVALAAAVASGLLAGMAPALAAVRDDVQTTLRDGAASVARGGAGRLRSALVIGEVALALILLSGAGLMVVSGRRLANADPGFRTASVLTLSVTLPEADYADAAAMRRFWDDLDRAAAELPGVTAHGLSSSLPMNWNEQRTTVARDDQPPPRPGEAPVLSYRTVSPEYFAALGVPLRAGRGLTTADGPDAPVAVVVSEAAQRKLWAAESAVGRRLVLRGGGLAEVVGVVANVRGNVLTADDPLPVLYAAVAQRPARTMYLVLVTAGDPLALAGPARDAIGRLDGRLAAGEVAPMTQVVAGVVSPQTATARSMAVGALIALLMAAAGTYGVMAYSVAQRTREIGVRVALGASSRAVVRLVLGQAGVMAGAGIVLGLAGSLAMGRVLSAVLFETNPADPAMLAGTAAVLALIALLASWLPTRRALQVNPQITLRAE